MLSPPLHSGACAPYKCAHPPSRLSRAGPPRHFLSCTKVRRGCRGPHRFPRHGHYAPVSGLPAWGLTAHFCPVGLAGAPWPLERFYFARKLLAHPESWEVITRGNLILRASYKSYPQSRWPDSNRRRLALSCCALPTELQRHICH